MFQGMEAFGRDKNISAKSFLLLLFLFMQLGVYSQDTRMQKVVGLYSCMKEYDIEYPEICLAIAIYETGWLECTHCAYQYNNLFGFRASQNYVRFESIYECLQYLKVWQTTYYHPWKAKHPNGTYYEYLAHMKYATGMSNYVNAIKHIESLVADDIRKMDGAPLTRPSIETEGR